MCSTYIKQYSVKIKCSFGKNGTGVIIKQNNLFYLATAKHNFTDETGIDTWKHVDEEMEIFKNKLNQIEIFKDDKSSSPICIITKIVAEYQDFIIFEIKDYKEKLENTQIFCNELSSSVDKKTKYFIQGYSESDGDSYVPNLHFINFIGDYKYTLIEPNGKRLAHLQGLSGSGVFVNIENNLYLVGILLEKNDDSSDCHIFNLPKYLTDNPQKSFDICNRKNKNDEIEIDGFELEIDSKAKKYMIIFIICVLGYIFLNKNDKVNNPVKIVNKIDLKGRVVNCTKGIPNVSIYVKDNFEKETETNDSGYFIIKDVSNKKWIKLCYEHNKVFEGVQCRKYQGDTNVSFCK